MSEHVAGMEGRRIHTNFGPEMSKEVPTPRQKLKALIGMDHREIRF
jgi:hypothetical protein